MLAITSKIDSPIARCFWRSFFCIWRWRLHSFPFLERQQARKKAIDWIVPNQLSIHRIAIDHHNPLTVNTTT